MNTKNLVAALGATALLANLVLPSISLAQTDTQTGTLEVGCPAYVAGDISFVRAPDDVTFDSVTAGVDVSSVDGAVTAAANLIGGNAAAVDNSGSTPITDVNETSITNDHLLRMTDRTSQGVDNCGAPGWGISAAVTSDVTDTSSASLKGLANTTTGQSGLYHAIHAEDLYLVTSEDADFTNIDEPETPVLADWTNPDSSPQGDAPVYYARYNTSQTGNPDNLFDPVAAGVATTSTAWETFTTYTTDGQSLDTSTQILQGVCTSQQGHYADIYLPVALALVDAVDTLQASGTYVGTVTYTYAPLAC